MPKNLGRNLCSPERVQIRNVPRDSPRMSNIQRRQIQVLQGHEDSRPPFYRDAVQLLPLSSVRLALNSRSDDSRLPTSSAARL